MDVKHGGNFGAIGGAEFGGGAVEVAVEATKVVMEEVGDFCLLPHEVVEGSHFPYYYSQ